MSRARLPGAPPTAYVLANEARIRLLLADALDLLRRDLVLLGLPWEDAVRRAEDSLELQEGPLAKSRRPIARSALAVLRLGRRASGISAALARGYEMPCSAEDAERARTAVRVARWRSVKKMPRRVA